MSRAARRDVRRHHDLVAALTETRQRIFALLLRAIRVEHGDLVTFAHQPGGHLVRTDLHAAKHDHALVFRAVEHAMQQVELLRAGARDTDYG